MKITVRVLMIIAVVAISTVYTVNAQVAINTDGTNPDASAMLHIKSTDKGFLIPNIALTSETDATTISSPATSLLIYNTATVGAITPGFYYWNGSKWIGFTSAEKKQLVINAFSVGFGAFTNHSSSVYVNGVSVSTSTLGIHLTVLSGSNGSLIFSKNYDTHNDINEGDVCAIDISTYNTDGNIIIINSYDNPSYISTNLNDALKEDLQSKIIAFETVDYRGAFCIIYQNGKGKLAEDISNAHNDTGDVIGNGSTTRTTASCNVTTFVGL